MVFTAVLYCKECELAKRPVIRELYMQITEEYSCFTKIGATDTHSYGLTPHLVSFLETKDDGVSYSTLCAMDKCGITIHRSKQNEPYLFTKAGKVLVEDGGEYYYMDGKILKKYEGIVKYHCTITREPSELFTTLRNWNALISSRI